jgi:AraC-like DNA-binding protein
MLIQIRDNYTQRLTLATIARVLGRQSAYLGRLFHEEIGVTVHEYITRARIAYGAAHVRSGVKIEAVALDLGYRSKKNFYRQFKRRFGKTPEGYRRAHLGIPERQQVSPGSGGENAPRLPSPRMMIRPTAPTRIAMLVTDDSGCYVGANRTAVAMTLYSVDELRGMSVEQLFPHVSVSASRCRLQLFVPGSVSLPTNTILQTKSAGPLHVHLTSLENVIRQRADQTGVVTLPTK